MVSENIDLDSCFSKVGSNELNAHLVIRFVIEASQLAPNTTWNLHDEGDALYCPLLVKNGLAKPDIDDMKKSLKYWQGKDYRTRWENMGCVKQRNILSFTD